MTDEEFVRIYDAHMPAILGYCAFRLGSRQDAEDLAAETFARLLARRHAPAPKRTSAWLFAVARNLCTDLERRLGRARREQSRACETSRQPEETVDSVWIDPEIRDALALLSPPQQEVIFLRAIQDMSFPQIGRALGRSEAAVKMQYHRAVRRVRSRLEEVKACRTSTSRQV